MHQTVHSAIEAANQGNKSKALELLKQVLSVNPNDVDAWMALAAITDDPQRKRQCLNRVLTIEPNHQLARNELLKLDGADTSASASLEAANVSNANFHEQTKPPFDAGKTRIFKNPLVQLIIVYVFSAMFIFFGLFIATKNLVPGLFFLAPGLIILVSSLISSTTVEVDEIGIKIFKGFSTAEIKWDDIVMIKTSYKLELTSNKGKILSITNRLDGFEQLIGIMRTTRPDLFGIVRSQPIQSGELLAKPENSRTNPAPRQIKTFQRNLFILFAISGFLIFVGFSFFLSAITIPVRSIARIGAWFGAAGFITGFSLLFQVITVTIDADRLILKTLWGKTILSRDDILDIRLHSPGNIRESVNVILNTGRQYSIQGFPDGSKVIYRSLEEWFNGI